jgi:uncharacterized protein
MAQGQAAAQERKITPPPINPETQAFWDATSQGKLLIKKCNDCGEVHFYPRNICPFCFSDQTEWQESSGRGTIYTYSVMRRAPVPYAIAYVELAEGPRIMTNIVDCDLNAIKIGQAVHLVFKPSEGGPPVPMFTPV